jgi:hypothetical protein
MTICDLDLGPIHVTENNVTCNAFALSQIADLPLLVLVRVSASNPVAIAKADFMVRLSSVASSLGVSVFDSSATLSFARVNSFQQMIYSESKLRLQAMSDGSLNVDGQESTSVGIGTSENGQRNTLHIVNGTVLAEADEFSSAIGSGQAVEGAFRKSRR